MGRSLYLDAMNTPRLLHHVSRGDFALIHRLELRFEWELWQLAFIHKLELGRQLCCGLVPNASLEIPCVFLMRAISHSRVRV